MPLMDLDASALLVRKLEKLADFQTDDRTALAGLSFSPEAAEAGKILIREGDVPTRCCLLVSGYACRHKTTSAGSRQIVSFHLAGDILDLQHLQLPKADHCVQTITHSSIAWVAAEDLRRLVADHPRINDALWRDALIDASIFREWVLNVGRRDARSRIAHMLCEFAVRREAAGLGSPEQVDLPMTQEQVADATGLTSVHVNRMVQSLRNDGALAHGPAIRILDYARMRKIADFDPAYLHGMAA